MSRPAHPAAWAGSPPRPRPAGTRLVTADGRRRPPRRGCAGRWSWRRRDRLRPRQGGPAERPQSTEEKGPLAQPLARTGEPPGSALLRALLPQALGHQAVHVLRGIGDGADAAVHRHAREAVGIEARDALVRLEPLDHAHRGRVHRLVEVGVGDVAHVVLRRFLRRAFQVLLALASFGSGSGCPS